MIVLHSLAEAARLCHLDKSATIALYKAADAKIVETFVTNPEQEKPRRYVRLADVKAWHEGQYKPHGRRQDEE